MSNKLNLVCSAIKIFHKKDQNKCKKIKTVVGQIRGPARPLISIISTFLTSKTTTTTAAAMRTIERHQEMGSAKNNFVHLKQSEVEDFKSIYAFLKKITPDENVLS